MQNRFIKHISIPEIGLKGQEKLLSSSVSVYGEKVEQILLLTLYLSAMGIGEINIYLDDNTGLDMLLSQAKDLNNEIEIHINSEIHSEYRIIVGNSNYINKEVELLKSYDNKFIPTIIAIINQWKMLIFTMDNFNKHYFGKLDIEEENTISNLIITLSGIICSIEMVKHILKIGNKLNIILQFDLYNLKINSYQNFEFNDALKDLFDNNIKYIPLEKVRKSNVLIVGAGGLGSPVALALAMLHLDTIGLVDYDKIEESNLNRQILHSNSRIGMLKVESARFLLNQIYPKTHINTYAEKLTNKNAQEIIKNYDLVILAVDNLQTRYLVNDVCYFLKKPLIEAGVLKFDGTVTTIIPNEGHCYRCIYPNQDALEKVKTQDGVLGAVPGVMGLIEAIEAYKIIEGIKATATLMNKILLFDGLEMEFNLINLNKNENCSLCGTM